MYCSSCGEDIPLGVRFCNHCGASTASELMRGTEAAGDPDATRVAGHAPSDPELTRLAGHDPEATRVASRSPFDDRRGAPTRVEQLPDRDAPLKTAAPQYRPASEPRDQSEGKAIQSRALEGNARRGAEVSAKESEDERVIFAVRPTLLFVGIGYAVAALGAIGLTVLLATYDVLPSLYWAPISLPLLLIPAFYHLRRNSVRYTLTDAKIEIDQGFLSRRTRNIPLRNIQDVTVQATIPQRLMRFGDLIVDNANEVGGSTTMRNIPDPRRHADMLLRELRRWS